MAGYDIIGDIHGYADELIKLLELMGYEKTSYYRHPNRKAIFLGDFIDRGPGILKTLQTVRPMVESGSAYSVMGNHEYNAVCFHSPKPGETSKSGETLKSGERPRPGETLKSGETPEPGYTPKSGKNDVWLRSRSPKNIMQHIETLIQFARADEKLMNYIRWFKTQPLFLEFEGFRVVHACWDRDLISSLKSRYTDGTVDDKFFSRSSVSGNFEKRIADTLLKGKEIPLPGVAFKDKDGVERSRIRIKWWQGKYVYYNDISFSDNPELPQDAVVPEEELTGIPWYPENGIPVFVGHYWLSGAIMPVAKNIACVDYSVALGGKLAAYRWDGETELDVSKFVSI